MGNKLLIEVLTPVHIGNWNTISWIDYFCYQESLKPPYKKNEDWKDIKNKSFLYKFKIQNFIDILEEKDKNDYYNLISDWSDSLDVRKFIYEKLEIEKNKYKSLFLEKIYLKIEIKNSFYNIWKDKIIWKPKQKNAKKEDWIRNEENNQLSQLNINSFISSFNRYYIPWSTLKWSIRTVLTNRNIDAIKYKYYNKKAEKHLDWLKRIETEKDPFKKIIVRDSDFIINWIEIWKLARQSNKWDWVYAEFLKPWITTNSEIIFKEFLDETNLVSNNFTKENLINSANKYLKEKLHKYINEIKILLEHEDINKKDSNWKLDKYSENKQLKLNSVKLSFEKILTELENLDENQFILNIWFWWWYWFKSFNWDEKHPKFCSIHDEWNHNQKNYNYECNSISWMPVKHLKSKEQVARTTWNIDLENLWFIKLTFN